MYGYSYRARLVGNGARNSLSYPPGGVGAEFEALCIVEFFHGFHQSQIAFLNQVEKKHTSADVTLGNADDKTQVGFAEQFFRLLVSFLHTTRKLRFLLGGKQRHLAYVFEIHFDGVVNAYVNDSLCQQVVRHHVRHAYAVVFKKLVQLRVLLRRQVEFHFVEIVFHLVEGHEALGAYLLERGKNFFHCRFVEFHIFLL